MPKRLWKKCMEFVMENSAGKVEKHFIDPRTGLAHKVRKQKQQQQRPETIAATDNKKQ
jgi:uncharacterized protein YcgI (DUF1989 family)